MRFTFTSALWASFLLISGVTGSHSSHYSRAVIEARDSELEARSSGVVTNCKKSGTFALTFDDGPYLYGGKEGDLIKSYGGHATFFVNGNNWACIYDNADELIRRYKAGHLIGAHTWGHDDITTLTADELNEQITLVETALKKILGIKPRIFRPPYGSYDPASVAILASRGYKVVTWSWDSQDSDGLSTSGQVKRYGSLYKKYPAPVLSLNHETYSTTNKTMAIIVPKLVSAGYKLVTVAECLGVSPYQSVGTPGKRDASWTCAGTPGPGAPH